MTNSNKSAKAITSANISLSIDGLDKVTKSVAVKTVSALTVSKTTVIKTTEGETRSPSSYFKNFRAQYKELENFLKLANAKGRTFNISLIHEIIMNGQLKPILEADTVIQNAKKVPQSTWSANRLFVAFLSAVETTAPKVKK